MADRSKDFFTETASMRTLTFPSSSQVDWSFRIGLGLVTLLAVTEIFGVGYHYLGRGRTARRAVQPAVALTTPAPAKVAPKAAPTIAPAAAPSVAPTVAAAAAAASPATSTLSVADRLLKEATSLRERGDTTNALDRLQQAAEKDPKNAQVLAEMAAIYESIQLYDRSNDTWRRITEIGPSAGNLYDLAQTKLKLGAAAPTLANAALAVAPAAPAPSAPPLGAETAAATRTGAEGVPEGAVFGISEVSVTESPDTDAETNLTLRISIKARPNTVIDHTKVTIRVYFYDTVGDNAQPVLTDAQTNHEWMTPNHDWISTNPEILAVTYFRPKNAAVSSEAALSAAAAAVVPGKKPGTTTPPKKGTAASAGDTGRRHYLGYIVRVYYNDKLQAQRAQPSKLLALFPSPVPSP